MEREEDTVVSARAAALNSQEFGAVKGITAVILVQSNFFVIVGETCLHCGDR